MKNHQPLKNILAISPIDNTINRVKDSSENDQIRQTHYIRASLDKSQITSQDFIALAQDYASAIGSELCQNLSESGSPWKIYKLTPTGSLEIDIDGSLYKGSAGITLFLAELNKINPNPEFREAAIRGLHYSIENCPDTFIGAFEGKVGLIYLLIHLFHLWRDRDLLELAIQLTQQIEPLISQDIYYDILHGVAGVIPVMIGLADILKQEKEDTHASQAILCAIKCANHLIKSARHHNNTLSWPCSPKDAAQDNLTGFSHGVAGIGWSLIKLGNYLNDDTYISYGCQAFAYEKSKFDEQEQNWYDLRTSIIRLNPPGPNFAHYWCSGSAGIGLSRIDSWRMLAQEDILSDAYTALDATVRHLQQLGNDSLCHGQCGAGELLLRFGLLRNDPSLQIEAQACAMAQWRSFEQNGRRWICGGGSSIFLPDLMLGIAGIGLHFLRLAHPDKVPSPLLLDAPDRG
jgi:lantibiotic modifying enzyme